MFLHIIKTLSIFNRNHYETSIFHYIRCMTNPSNINREIQNYDILL